MAEGSGKKFIVGLILVVMFAYGMAMTGISIYFIRQVDELNLEALSLELACDEAKKKTEQMNTEVKNLEEQAIKMQKMLSSLNEETKNKIDQLVLEVGEYKEKNKVLEKKINISGKEASAVKEESKKLKKLLEAAAAESSEGKNKENEELKAVLAKKTEEVKLQEEENKNLKNELSQKEAQIHYNLGVNFFQRQDFDNAIVEYQKAVEANSSHGPSYYNLGMLCEEYKQDYPQAAEYYRKYLKFTPDAKDGALVEEWILELEAKTEQAIY